MSYCTDLSIVRDYGGFKKVATLRCKKWDCEHCGPKRARDLRWRCRNASPTKFLTLTVRKGQFPTPDEQARQMVEAWRMLRQYLCRLLGWKSIPFIAIFEKHKSGWPHLHILLRCKYIDHRLIREWWNNRLNSFKIDIREVKSEQHAAYYVSKYLTKSPHAFAQCKRYWASHDYDLAKPEVKAPEDEGLYIGYIVRGRPTTIAKMALIDRAEITFDGFWWTIFRWTDTERHRWYR